MKKIEDAAFDQRNCVDATTSVSSHSLSLNSFWGLFLIVGIAASAALLIFAATLVYEHRSVLTTSSSDSEPSLWRRFLNLLRIYNQKDLNSHTFRKSELNDRFVLSLPPSIAAPSPSSYSAHTDFSVEQGSPSAECVHSSCQQPQEVKMNVELANQNQERATTVNINNANN